MFALLALASSGCSQFEVRSKQDPGASFAGLKTFAWLPASEAQPADQRVNDDAVDRRIRAATERDLQEKGYQPAGAGRPDFLLNYRLARSSDDAVLTGQGKYANNLWGGWPGIHATYDSHDEGTLYLAAVNPDTKRMLWVGAAHGRLLPHISWERRAKRVDTAVEKILASFPKQ